MLLNGANLYVICRAPGFVQLVNKQCVRWCARSNRCRRNSRLVGAHSQEVAEGFGGFLHPYVQGTNPQEAGVFFYTRKGSKTNISVSVREKLILTVLTHLNAFSVP